MKSQENVNLKLNVYQRRFKRIGVSFNENNNN